MKRQLVACLLLALALAPPAARAVCVAPEPGTVACADAWTSANGAGASWGAGHGDAATGATGAGGSLLAGAGLPSAAVARADAAHAGLATGQTRACGAAGAGAGIGAGGMQAACLFTTAGGVAQGANAHAGPGRAFLDQQAIATVASARAGLFASVTSAPRATVCADLAGVVACESLP